jgi:demethylmenaquinone methyltransferase/2-methoxy-6-polyprenyl-1,4-benzoquinol methylase
MSAQISKARELYAALAPQYDAETRYISGIRNQAIAALALRAGETVLDAGCGTGWCLPALAAGVGSNGRVFGFEPSPDMLDIARRRARDRGLSQVELQNACGETVQLRAAPDAILFSYTHDLIRSRAALQHIFRQARPGTRIVACSTRLFPKWFIPGNWYLRHTHRLTITNFDSFDRPWTILAELCADHRVRTTMPGSRYLFEGVLGEQSMPN